MSFGHPVDFALPRLTPAVKALMIANAAVFLVNWVLGGRLCAWLGVSWAMLWDGYGLGLLRLVTYQFVHDYHSPLHLLFNLLFLYFFGTFVEGGIGRAGLYRLYFGAGLAGAVGFLLVSAATGSTLPVVGASGAVYGIMMYAAFMAPRMRVILIVFPVELRFVVGLLVFLGLYQVSLELQGHAGPGGVAHGAHLGGAAWGFVAYRYLRSWHTGNPYEVRGGGGLLARWRALRAEHRRRDAQRRAEILDGLLDKVRREGMSALSAAERRFLERESRERRGR